jgi:hypothetical protein
MGTTVLTAELRAGSVAGNAEVQNILAAPPQQQTNRGGNHPGRSCLYSDSWQPELVDPRKTRSSEPTSALRPLPPIHVPAPSRALPPQRRIVQIVVAQMPLLRFEAVFRHRNTRKACLAAVAQFSAWSEDKGLPDLARIELVHVAGYPGPLPQPIRRAPQFSITVPGGSSGSHQFAPRYS